LKINKVPAFVIVVLIISHIFFMSELKQHENREMYMINRGMQNINSAVSEMNKLNDSWSETDQYYSDQYYKLFYISHADEYLGRAMENLNDGQKYFYPLKEYQSFLHAFKITMESSSDIEQKEQLERLTKAFNALGEFIGNNDINELSQDELLEKWVVFRMESNK